MMDGFKGWTRRVLAFSLGIGGFGVLCAMAWTGNETALGAVATGVGVIVTFYFTKAES